MQNEMPMTEKTAKRKPVYALLLALLCPGLGLVYAGRQRVGLSFFFGMVFGLPLIVLLGALLQVGTFSLLIWFTATGLAAAISQAVWSVTAAKRAGCDYALRRFNHLGVYLGMVVLNMLSPASMLMKHTALETFKTPSQSMSPTLLPGDYLAAVKGHSFKPGDIVVLRRPPREQEEDIEAVSIYRILAKGGDSIEMRDDVIYLNESPLPRKSVGALQLKGSGAPFGSQSFQVFEETLEGRTYRILETQGIPNSFGPTTVPAGHCFVLGDNRDNANDSRYFGALPKENIIAVADAIYLSIDPDDGLRSERIGMGLRSK